MPSRRLCRPEGKGEVVHHYVFTFRDGWEFPVYERTFPDRFYAYRWLLGRKHDGFVLTDMLPKRYYY